MGSPVLDHLAVLQLIESDLPVFTARREHIGVRTPSDARDRSRMGVDRHIVAAAERFPNEDTPAPVSGGQQDAVW